MKGGGSGQSTAPPASHGAPYAGGRWGPSVKAARPTDLVQACLSFLATGDCEIATFTFTAESFRPGVNAPALLYVQVERYGDDTFGLSFPDDYRIRLMAVTRTTMTWASPQSGDIFECARLSCGKGSRTGGE